MRLVLRLGAAAIGFAALAACDTGQDNAAETVDANAAMTTNQSVLPIDDNAVGTDTLGNQLNQLNETGDSDASADANAAANGAGNTSEGQ